MQFIYHENAGINPLVVDLKVYEHLFKVRRMGAQDTSLWRNLNDAMLYQYRITHIGKKEAELALIHGEEKAVLPERNLFLGWCVIDPKIIEKTLPMLNELGVFGISFVYADFSQKNHKLDYERMKRILINSSQQCGRSSLMQLEEFASVEAYTKAYPKSQYLDFCDTPLSARDDVSQVLIGPEGGFSTKERALIEEAKVVGLTCKTILRSETAVVSIASKILV